MFFQVRDIYNHETPIAVQEHYGILSLKVTFGVHIHIKKNLPKGGLFKLLQACPFSITLYLFSQLHTP